ncbi:cyclase family protein [Scytonema sp. UIC 10036]|uniref:cyclase family protein n=1 Tax=Scytonema sp. UIC 10036 TaxID=2304196 RepID=UPI0012DACFAB|nr:cyclase family protein [Scytonema sp. UIC 10036]MUG98245.1 cyclase family protein [Scytonema sp. UIC 10036]
MKKTFLTIFAIVAVLVSLISVPIHQATSQTPTLWNIYKNTLKTAKYVDLTHAFNPTIPVWSGFKGARFKPSVAGTNIPNYSQAGQEYTYKTHGFIATAYEFPTDQYGTQLDPPAHWNEYGATISDLPPTYAVRPLVIIDIHKKVEVEPGYHATVEDILAWEKKYGTIPEGSVVMIRSDWYKKWSDVARFNQKPFPGITLDALKFLHLKRNILFHGHEPLDTDTTPTLEGEAWLLRNHYTQAEGVANLDRVPETGALVAIGFAKPEGGTGGFARYIAICPSNWSYGVSIAEAPGAPLLKQPYRLQRDANGVLKPTRS